MQVRLRPLPSAAFAAIAITLDATRGLAGPLSRAAAVLPILFAAASLAHLVATWIGFGFHEEFSTDHPLKGDVIRYSIHLRNGLPFPSAPGICRFASVGPMPRGLEELPLQLGSGESMSRESRISCAYRGVYVIGAKTFAFRGALGIIELEHEVEPRVFYVYPELVALGPLADRLAEGGGEERSSTGGGTPDPTVIDGLRPLADGRPAGRVAWKRWAATGIPCEPIEGRSSAFGLRVVLDLRPPLAEGPDRLAAEDLAVSAVYSVLSRLVDSGIPAEFVLGGEETGRMIEDRSAFDSVYATSTSVLFTDTRFPLAAFSDDRASLLVTTRSIAGTESAEDIDLFGPLEAALARSRSVSVLVVAPPPQAERERTLAFAAHERLRLDSRRPAFIVLDPSHGTEDLIHAFSV